MIDDKKEYEIGDTYNCGCNKKYTYFVDDFSYMYVYIFLLERTYFADIKK